MPTLTVRGALFILQLSKAGGSKAGEGTMETRRLGIRRVSVTMGRVLALVRVSVV